MRASKKGRLEAVELLLSRGAKVNMQDKRGLTALMFAAVWGELTCANALLLAGADMSLTTTSEYYSYDAGCTALDLAVLGHKSDVAALLLEHHCPAPDREFIAHHGVGLSILHEAVQHSMWRAAHQIVLRYDIDPSALIAEDRELYRSKGRPATIEQLDDLYHLCTAARASEPDVRALLETGFDPDALAYLYGERRTALHRVVEAHNEHLIELLAKAGSDLDAQDDSGLTPLAIAVMSNNEGALVQLLALGADPKLSDKDGRTPEMHVEDEAVPLSVRSAMRAHFAAARAAPPGGARQ
eukprot:PLAT7979.2.p1 GENE.PLAT7979.2~~PLAT7979.2.p1  ORF type:complete len:343 (+),score=95.77 PLAT7979.2:136-1029(+)